MNRQHIAIVVVATLGLVCSVARSDDNVQSRKGTKANPAPVVLTSRVIKSKSRTDRKIEIQLAVGRGYEIYAERKHEFVLPLKPELLDAKMRPITSTIQYPKPTIVPFDKALGGDYFVHRGNVKLVANYAVDAKPAYVRVFYHGNYKQQR